VSRKSKLQRTRLDELDRRLQSCHRQGADEAFIELVQDRSGDATRCPAARLYGEVVDRALRRALAAGDLARSERIWRHLLRDARSRPLALVAGAACHLAAGRLDEARRALAELTAAGDGVAVDGGGAAGGSGGRVAAGAADGLVGAGAPGGRVAAGASGNGGEPGAAGGGGVAEPAPAGLLAKLAALAGPSLPGTPPAASALSPPAPRRGAATPPRGAAAPPRGAADLERLGQAMAPRPAGGVERKAAPSLPGKGGLDTAEAQTVWSFYRGLATLGAGGPPPETAEIRELGRTVASMRLFMAGDRAAADLLAATDRCLLALAAIAAAETTIRRRQRGRPARRTSEGIASLLGVAREVAKPLLAVRRADAWHPLLEPLRQALRERWRSLLAWLAEQPDAAAAWAELHAISPQLLALDVEVGAVSSPGSGAQPLRRWSEARSLLSAGRFGELARWLVQAAKSEQEPWRLVQLWSLELWAWDREDARVHDGEAGAAPFETAPPLIHQLLRLEQMAAQCRHGIPHEHQRGVARVLAATLTSLCQGVRFCRSMAVTAESLLLYLPDDPGLLVAGLAGAACSSNPDAARRFASRIAARGVADANDQERVLQLVSEIVAEETSVAAPVLCQLRPLLPEAAWPRVQGLMAQELASVVCGSYRFGLGLEYRLLRRDLELCRSTLGDTAELAALAAAVDCVDSAVRCTGHALRQALARLPGLEPALIACRVLAVASTHGDRSVEEAFEECRRLTLDRLDERWRLWRPLLVPLVMGADRRQRQRLRSMLAELGHRRDISDIDRKAYHEILEEIDLVTRVERQTRRGFSLVPPFEPAAPREPGERRTRGAGGRRRTRPKADGDDQLDFGF
jgi:hypothetical protein